MGRSPGARTIRGAASSCLHTPRTGWARLELVLGAGAEERALALLPGDCLGVEIAPGAGSRLRAYWETLAAAHAAERELRRAFGARSGSAIVSARVTSVADEAWVERYQAGLAPFPLGRRFVVIPSGKPCGTGRRIPILLSPGRAFGTGEHPTTALCVEALEEHARPGQCWVDLGTGSGILAVVAAGCGVERILALDLDPEALRVARRVVRANGVGESVEVRLGSIERAAGRRWNGVVANVDRSFLRDAAAALAGTLGPGGVLISSGIPRAERVAAARGLERAGLERVASRARGEWAALVHRRPGAGR